MLSKINRIKDKKQFALILNKGAKFFCPFFLFILDRDVNDLPQPEFGFITSKKVGGAVLRNHVRRLLSEIIIKDLPLLKPNTRGLIIAHNRSTTLSFAELQKEVQTIFSKAKLYI